MRCRTCDSEIQSDARFCSHCGCRILSEEEMEMGLQDALEEAQSVFEAELENVEKCLPAGTGQDEPPQTGSQPDNTEGSAAATRSRLERLTQMGHAVRRGAQGAVRFTKKVGDGTVHVVKKSREISADISEKVGTTVEKTKEFGEDVAVTAKKVGHGVGKAVRKTRETMEELGQVGVVITQRALDVVRASLKAVEIVDQYLEQRHSNFEIGNFVTGVALPPYLEIEFTKRSSNLSDEEKALIEFLRKSGLSCSQFMKALGHSADSEPQANLSDEPKTS